jgi:signal transduction histidine kinase/CheY-like chemotaxis protein
MRPLLSPQRLSPQRIAEPPDLAQLDSGRLAAILRAWLGCSGDLVLLLDGEGRVTGAARTAAEFSHRFLPRLTGAAWRTLWPKPHRRQAMAALAAAAAGGAGHFQAPLAEAGEAVGWWDVVLAPVANAGPGGAQLLAVLRDVSALKQEDERQARSRRLEAVGRLAGGVAHDFNNLLTVIVGAAESLIEACDDGEARSLAETSLQAAERGADLVRRLLAFARPPPRSNAASCDAASAVEAVARLLRRTLPDHVRLEAEAPAALLYCRAERGELENALLNLCINARDAMPRGGRIALTVERKTLDGAQARMLGIKAGEHALFTVEDDGAGMSPETAARAIEPFFSTKGEAGTGLGLSAVNSLAAAAGGALVIRSRLGQGTRIELYVPRARAAAQAELDLAPPPGAAVACDVLLVEDDPAVRAGTARLLRALGCRVTAAEDAEDALGVLAGGAPVDLIITDIGLPYGLDGRALAEAARGLRPDLKTLFISGHEADACGADFLPKPFGRAALARAIQRQFARPAPAGARPKSSIE